MIIKINGRTFDAAEVASRSSQVTARAASLADSKGRDAAGLFLCEGVKLVAEAARSGAAREIYIKRGAEGALAGADGEAVAEAVRAGTALYVLSEPAFEKVTTERAPQGICCAAAMAPFARAGFFGGSDRVIMLENVRDPGNIGTVMRTAAAFGFAGVVFAGDCADPYNTKAVRGAMGAHFRLALAREKDAAEAVRTFARADRRVLAAMPAEGALTLGADEILPSDVVVIGNEGHGLSPETVAACTGGLRIPMAAGAESLNAAVAAAVVMWEQSKGGLTTGEIYIKM